MTSLLERMNRKDMREKAMENRRSKKIPFTILVDTSGTMQHNDNIGKVNRGLRSFYDVMREDSKLCDALDISIVTFGKDGVQLAVDFDDIRNQHLPTFEAAHNTPLCEALTLAIDNIEDQIDVYQSLGIGSTQPIMLIMTDGEPSQLDYSPEGDPIKLQKTDLEFIEVKKKFDYFAKLTHMETHIIAMGHEFDDLFFLEQFSTNEKSIKRLEDTNILAFFKHLTQSVSGIPKAVNSMNNQVLNFGEVDIFNEIKKKK